MGCKGSRTGTSRASLSFTGPSLDRYTWRARSYRHVESILKNGLDRLPSPAEEQSAEGARRGGHENIRGGGYYH